MLSNQVVITGADPEFVMKTDPTPKPLTPMTGSVAAQPSPTKTQLNSANVNSSVTGWLITNEHDARIVRLGDSRIDDTSGFPIYPKTSVRITSSKLEGFYVVSPSGPATVSVLGESG